MKLITLQFSPRTDHITEDGTELTQRPYPFHVAEGGAIQRQDVWQGDPNHLIGFVADLARHEVDIRWAQVWADPQLAIGKYAVTSGNRGMASYLYAVETATAVEV